MRARWSSLSPPRFEPVLDGRAFCLAPDGNWFFDQRCWWLLILPDLRIRCRMLLIFDVDNFDGDWKPLPVSEMITCFSSPRGEGQHPRSPRPVAPFSVEPTSPLKLSFFSSRR